MNTKQVANRLVELCRIGENMQAINELYDQNVVSKEMQGVPNSIVTGKEAVTKKVKTGILLSKNFMVVKYQIRRLQKIILAVP